MECGPCSDGVLLRNESTVLKNEVVNLIPEISTDTLVYRSAWVKVNGIVYKSSNAFVLCKISSVELAEPTFIFGCIEEIVVIGSTLVLFVVCTFKSEYFDDHSQ